MVLVSAKGRPFVYMGSSGSQVCGRRAVVEGFRLDRGLDCVQRVNALPRQRVVFGWVIESLDLLAGQWRQFRKKIRRGS
jgi:hypothetical protein